MKNIFASLLLGFVCLVPVAYAEEQAAEVVLPDPGVLPTSSFYWIDVLSEQWQLWTVSDEKRPELLQKLMNEKLAEVVATIEHTKSAAQAGERFEQYFTDLGKTVGVDGAGDTYASFIDTTVVNLDVLSATVSDHALAEPPAFVSEMITTMARVHQDFLHDLSEDDQSTAANALLSKVQALPVQELSASAQKIVTQFVQSIFSWIAEFFKDRYTQLSSQAQAYLKAQATTYIDSLKADLIQGIQSIHLP